MTLLSGVFFPLQQLPSAVQAIAQVLPLTHAVALMRPLALGQVPEQIALHLTVLVATGALAFVVALGVARRRLMS
jgi:lipooligosaccharide transport system permease protein